MTFNFAHPYKKRTVIHRRPIHRPSIFFGRNKDNNNKNNEKSSSSSSRSVSTPGPLISVSDRQDSPLSPLSHTSSTPNTSSLGKSNSLSPPASASTAPTSTDAYSSSFGSRLGLTKSLRSNSPTPSAAQPPRNLDRSKGSDETTHTELRSPPNFRCPWECRDYQSIKPSVATIESTAATKVFFETYFNTLLSPELTAREQRRRLIEAELALATISREEKAERIRQWCTKESDYLRQSRALKSKSLIRRNAKGISVAGYEVVRVLGKGSFGIVRLVREKRLPHPKARSNEQTESDIERLDGSDDERGRYDPSRISKQVYAMKVIRKSDMLRNCQEGHLRAERDFLVASENSRWVVPLVASFQDNTNLYLVMEYMVGGDFLGLLMREDVLDEPTARWYVAEMILCLEEAHRMKWIHRDIKPDNFLITASGHLKISDFGLAFDGHWAHNQTYFNEKRYSLLKKFGIDVRGDDQDVADEGNPDSKSATFGNVVTAAFGRSQRIPSMFAPRDQQPAKEPPGKDNNPVTWMNRHQKRRLAKSIVGTSQYMAPEVIRGEEYDGRCDWWSIGIILYECLYGQTPFYCQERKDTKQKIVHHHHFLSFPPEQRWGGPSSERVLLAPVSFTAISLMQSLLTDKEIRLSSPRYRENDIRHDFLPRYHQRPHPHHRSFSVRSSGAAPNMHQPPVAPPAAPFGSAAGRHVSASVMPPHQPPHQRYFVFPDDAHEIKDHIFFSGIDWEHLHLMRPPFVPHIRAGQDLAKYFDDENQILSSDEAAADPDADSGTTNIEGGSHDDERSSTKVEKEEEEAAAADPMEELRNAGAANDEEKSKAKSTGKARARRNKEKRRPRDKLLRDPLLKRQVMEARKKGAFVGYTYRRPKEFVARRRCVGGSEMGAFVPQPPLHAAWTY